MPPDDDARHDAWLTRHARTIPFFTLVQHVERLHPDAPPVGGAGPVADEAIRFHHDPGLVFHASDVVSLEIVRVGERLRYDVTTGFLGVIGAVSPLATFFTEEVMRGESQDDRTLRDFYDLFHHRILGLFYRVLVRAEPAARVRTTGDDPFTRRALSAIGLAARPSTEGAVTPRQLLGRARLFARRPRSIEALEAALALALPWLPTRVRDFLPRSVVLAPDQRTQLGVRNATLGRGARVGRHLLRQTGLVRVEAGPVDRAGLEALMPGGEAYARMRAVAEEVVGALLDVEVEIEIACGEEPRARLGASHAARLGIGSLVTRPRVGASDPVRARVALTDDAEEARPAFLVPPT